MKKEQSILKKQDSKNYKVIIRLNEIGSEDNFKEAYALFHSEIEKGIGSATITLRDLESTCWIETPENKCISFFEARDRAYDEGFLKDGKLNL